MYKILENSTELIGVFAYEIAMMNGIYKILFVDKNLAKNEYVRNALVESFLLHTRNIIDFLHGKTKYNNDLTCKDFVDKDGEYITYISFPVDKNLSEKINKYLSHITKERATGNIGWDIPLIRFKLINGIEHFFEACDDSCFGKIDIKKLRADLKTS